MATAYTSLLGLALPVQGELQGTWGDTVNNSITSLLDTAVAGTTTLNTDADVTLSTTTGAANQARQAIILWTANGTVTRNITAPAQSKIYTVINKTAGSQSIVIRGVGPTTGVTIPAGFSATVAWDGTDFVDVSKYIGGNLTVNGNFAVNGNTTLGNAAADTLTVTATVTSNVIFTDNTYDIGASGATRPRTGYFGTSVISPLLTATNLQVTNIKANDGTAAASIANSTGIITVSTELNVDNLNLSGNTISSTDANGNITLTPNGTGDVVLSADTVQVGDSNATATITTNGTGDLVLNTNSGTNAGSITLANGANGNITIAPNGTGDVYIDADTLRVGDAAVDATIQSNGNADLILKTGNATTGTVTLADGANGNLTLALNGTGQVVFNAGAVGTPTIAPTGDLNTGFWFPAADTIAASTGGSERMRIDSSGNVGIGVTPSAWRTQNKTVQLGATGVFTAGTSATSLLGLGSNWYLDSGSILRYIASDFASNYEQSSGRHIWSYAASGTAGNSFSFTEAMRIDSSGNVGIGTSSPAANTRLNIASSGETKINMTTTGTGSGTRIFLNNQNGYDLEILSAGDASGVNNLGFASNSQTGIGANYILSGTKLAIGTYNNYETIFGTNNTERMRINSSGNVGIGTTAPGDKFVVSNDGNAGWEVGATTLVNVQAYNRSSSAYIDYKDNCLNRIFATNGTTERARITSDGDFLVGTTNNSGAAGAGVKLYPSGGIASVRASGDGYTFYNTTASAYRFYVTDAGQIYATSTTITGISDARLKENIRELDDGLNSILALKPRKFDWKEGKGKDIKDDRGFVAQEFEEVFPDLIDVWKDEPPEGEEPYKSVRADLIPVLVKAIQELKAITDAQATRIEALEAEVAALKGN